MNNFLPLVSLASIVCLAGFAAHVPQVSAAGAAPGKIVVGDAIENLLVEADGTPLAGARVYPVYMTDPSGGPYGDGGSGSRSVLNPIVVDAAGKFRMPDVPTNFINHLIVLPPASTDKPGQAPAPFFATVSKESPARIVRPKSVPLQVRFTDSSNKPLAGKEVMIFPALPPAFIRAKTETANRLRAVLPAESLAFVVDAGFPDAPPELKAALTARTDASGTVRFAALPQNERVSLTIAALPGHRPLVLAGSVALTPAPVPSLTVHLPLNGVITGQVLHRTKNRAIAGARVMLSEPGAQGGLRALGPKTDSEGRFRFTGLYPGDYQLGFDGLDSPDEMRYLQDETVKVTLTGESRGGMTAQKEVFVTKAARVEVTVRDAEGRPVFAQEVMLNRKDGGGGGITGLDGQITIYDLPGERELVWTRSGENTKKGDIVRRPVTLIEGETQSFTLGTLPTKDGLRALAPDFVGWDEAGKAVHLSAFRNKVVVLDFVYLSSSSDTFAQAETAARELEAENKRVVFLAICTGDWQEKMKPGWLAERSSFYVAQYPHLRFVQDKLEGSGSGQAAYRVNGWPHRFVIGPDGTLRASYGSSGYGANGSNYVSINDTKRLLTDIRAALKP